MPDLTTLQLAERIVDAVLDTPEEEGFPAAAQAVLRVLHETDSWFCRLKETPQGTVETVYEQVELFP